MEKLLEASKIIKYREGIKPHEGSRVQDAFTLIGGPTTKEGTSQAAHRRKDYQWFLKKIREAVGPQMIVLCAVGLGQSALGSMRDRVRLEFLEEIKKRGESLRCAVLQRLVEEHYAKCLPLPNLSLKHMADFHQ